MEFPGSRAPLSLTWAGGESGWPSSGLVGAGREPGTGGAILNNAPPLTHGQFLDAGRLREPSGPMHPPPH